MKKRSLKTLKNKLWKIFSEYVRRKDADIGGFEHCYTCAGVPKHWKELQCGHAIPGRTNSVLFDESICRPQCPKCNVFMGGNYQVFTYKLIKEHGLSWWEEKLIGSRKVVKFTHGDLEQMIETYQNKLKELEAKKDG